MSWGILVAMSICRKPFHPYANSTSRKNKERYAYHVLLLTPRGGGRGDIFLDGDMRRPSYERVAFNPSADIMSGIIRLDSFRKRHTGGRDGINNCKSRLVECVPV